MEPLGMIFLLNLEFMCAIYVPKDWRFSWIQSVVGCGAEVWLCGSVNRFCCDGNRFCGPVNRFCGGGNRFRGPVNRFCGGGNRFCGGGNRFLPTADWRNVDGNDWDRMEAALGPRGAKGALVAEKGALEAEKGALGAVCDAVPAGLVGSVFSSLFSWHWRHWAKYWLNNVIKTVCPSSSDPFHIVTYYIKWVTTSWTHSIYNIVYLR